MITHPGFDPVVISIGPVSIHWYGLMYLLGFLAGGILGRVRALRPGSGWKSEEIPDLLFYIVVGVVLGGRLGYVAFYNLPYYLDHLPGILAIWDGGMSFHGGLLGVIVAVWLYGRKTRRSLFAVCDFLAPLIPLGLLFGRVGNFINQELWGRPTDLPWGVWFHTMPDQPRHPSQLYEAGLEGLFLFVLIWWYSSHQRPSGRVAGMFLLGYGISRFVVEFVREPDAHLGLVALEWMSMGQVLSLPMVLLGAWLMIRNTESVTKTT